MGAAEKKEPRFLVTLTDVDLIALVRDMVRDELARAQPVVSAETDELTTAQAAKALGISPEALRHHIARGHIKPDFPGGKRGRKSHAFTRATLDAFRRRTSGNADE